MTETPLTPEEAAERSGFSRWTIYRAIQAGELRAMKVRSRLKIRKEDLERWLEGGTVEPTPAAPAPAAPRPRPSRPSAPRRRGSLRELMEH